MPAFIRLGEASASAACNARSSRRRDPASSRLRRNNSRRTNTRSLSSGNNPRNCCNSQVTGLSASRARLSIRCTLGCVSSSSTRSKLSVRASDLSSKCRRLRNCANAADISSLIWTNRCAAAAVPLSSRSRSASACGAGCSAAFSAFSRAWAARPPVETGGRIIFVQPASTIDAHAHAAAG
ncbi:hypothetical protein D3C87_1199350 [compost metagenome]